MMKFYVTHEGKQFGPWSVAEIQTSLEKQNLFWTDYLYDESKSDWVLLAEHSFFQPLFKQNQSVIASGPEPLQKATPFLLDPQSEKQWFVLKGENKYGPFAYLEIVRMLQEKNLYEYDYVWNHLMKTWTRVAECEEFKIEKIKQLLASKEPHIEEVFFRRRHARVDYGASVLVHNSKRVWRGRSVELSPGGAGLYITTKELEPGQTLFLHFKVGKEVPPFNAICSIVSKQYASPGASEIKYGVKFTKISKDVQLVIRNISEKVAA